MCIITYVVYNTCGVFVFIYLYLFILYYIVSVLILFAIATLIDFRLICIVRVLLLSVILYACALFVSIVARCFVVRRSCYAASSQGSPKDNILDFVVVPG